MIDEIAADVYLTSHSLTVLSLLALMKKLSPKYWTFFTWSLWAAWIDRQGFDPASWMSHILIDVSFAAAKKCSVSIWE